MATTDPFEEANRPLDKKLLRYIWRNTRAEQIWILMVVIASMPTYFLVLDLPVRIINEPIQGVGFESADATLQFLDLSISLPEFLGGATWQIFEGFALERWPYLLALSCSFLTLITINGLFKFYINTYKGRLGERMLRRMRYQLVDRVLRFPINHFRRVKGSEVASMVKDEVEPFGEFIGDAFVQPVYLGGQALVAFIFIMLQSFWLGMIAVGVIAIQVTVIPYLRRRILELGRQRQITARLLSGRIGEIVDGIAAVHVNDTSNYERAELTHRLGKIFFIRYELYQRKFFIKFLNNFLAQVTPFLFYVVGGYFAIRGTLNVGQLLGVINAYKDLPAPINGLVQWDQKRVDIEVKYAQIVEQFNVSGTMDARMQAPTTDKIDPLTGTIVVSNLGVVDDTATVLLEDADFSMEVSDIVAAIGPIGSGAGTLANTIAGLQAPTSGRLMIADRKMQDLPEAIRGRRFAFAGSESYLPQSSLFDAIVYVSKHVPLVPADPDNLPEPLHPRAAAEVKASGNSTLDYQADWVDYEAMGISGPDELYRKIHEVLEVVEMDDVVYALAMRQKLDPTTYPQLTDKLIDMRNAMNDRISQSELNDFVSVWDWDRYNENASIAENLLFGTPVDEDTLQTDRLSRNEHIRAVLRDEQLDRAMFDMGMELAETAIELFADLSPDNPFFEQLNFMTPEQLESYPPILQRAREKGFDGASDADKGMLIELPFGYIEKRNRLKLLDEKLEERILKARHRFHETLPDDMKEAISIYDVESYNPINSLQDNILFGKIAYGTSNASEKVNELIGELMDELGIRDDIFRIGLEFDIGTGGKRLSENQRQRIVLGRALLKGCDLLIINRGLNSLDGRAQAKLVKRVVERARNTEHRFGVLWVLATSRLAEEFDQVLVFDRQRLVAKGTPQDLAQSSDTYKSMVA
ncbi:MAG: ABC transporter transmembrane domain-containing protein [Ahrensia sp.]|nr:ABC transporter transmembrane domain-containing protein [Ahrensia sp.]